MWIKLLDGTLVNLDRVDSILPTRHPYPSRIMFPADAHGESYIEISVEEYDYIKETLGFPSGKPE